MPLSRTPTVLVGALDRCQEARVLILALMTCFSPELSIHMGFIFLKKSLMSLGYALGLMRMWGVIEVGRHG